jgi:hypothetical protein
MSIEIKPYLIQRGSFKNISDNEIVGIDSLISFEYMGFSEFEWGSIPKAMIDLCQHWHTYKILQVDEIQDIDGNFFYYVAPESFSTRGDPATAEDLRAVMINLFTKRFHYRLKEPSYCYERIHGGSFGNRIPDTNFWWDIENNWMACFGADIKRLILAIQKVCEKKALPYEGGPSVLDKVFSVPVFALDIVKSKVTVTDFSGNMTIIHLKNVAGVSEGERDLIVQVKTKSGDLRNLSIQVSSGIRRDYLVRILQEAVDRSNSLNFINK